MKKIDTVQLPLDGLAHNVDVNGRVVYAERWASDLVLYVEQNEDALLVTRALLAVETGTEVHGHATHVVTSGGGEGFIWHVYDLSEPEEDDGAAFEFASLTCSPSTVEEREAAAAVLSVAYEDLRKVQGLQVYYSQHVSFGDDDDA